MNHLHIIVDNRVHGVYPDLREELIKSGIMGSFYPEIDLNNKIVSDTKIYELISTIMICLDNSDICIITKSWTLINDLRYMLNFALDVSQFHVTYINEVNWAFLIEYDRFGQFERSSDYLDLIPEYLWR